MSLVQSSDQFANNPIPTTNSPSSYPQSGSSSTHSSTTTPSSHSTPSSSSSDVTDSSAPGTVDTTTPSKSGTSTASQKATSGQTGASSNAANDVIVPDTTPVITTTSSSSIPAPTPTTTSSSTHLPTSTSTSSSALPTSASTSTHSTSTSLPVPTATATSTSTTASHVHTTVTSTDASGGVVVMTQTIFNPISTSIPGVSGHSADDTTGPNIGAIIGGIAGGLVGVILLTWLILIPIRKRAALKKEVDWMAFGSENDHHNNESNNDSIYRTPRAGVGELESKVMDSPEMYAMSDIGSAAHQGTLYSHLDANASSNWAGTGSAGIGSYNVANHVVGEAPPGQQYDGNYAAYYPAAITVQQQQPQQQYQQQQPQQQQPQQQHQQHQQPQTQYGTYPSYSDHGSPETGAQRYAGQQQPWPTTSTSTSSHGHQPSATPVNNYPFAPPTVVSGHSMSRNASLNDRVLLSHGNSFSASTVTAHEGNVPNRSASDQAGLPPMPGMQTSKGQASHQESSKADAEDDDCALAYVLDDTEDTPMPDKGAIPGLHLANPDR